MLNNSRCNSKPLYRNWWTSLLWCRPKTSAKRKWSNVRNAGQRSWKRKAKTWSRNCPNNSNRNKTRIKHKKWKMLPLTWNAFKMGDSWMKTAISKSCRRASRIPLYNKKDSSNSSSRTRASQKRILSRCNNPWIGKKPAPAKRTENLHRLFQVLNVFSQELEIMTLLIKTTYNKTTSNQWKMKKKLIITISGTSMCSSKTQIFKMTKEECREANPRARTIWIYKNNNHSPSVNPRMIKICCKPRFSSY